MALCLEVDLWYPNGVELWRMITVVCYFANEPAEFDTHWLRVNQSGWYR